MTATEQSERKRKEDERGDDKRCSGIGERVIRALGRPEALHAVQVRRLWGDHYRVNVLVGAEAMSASVAHSYFLVVDEDGAIRESTPEITRRY
jgi:hypothetical protein